jgi:endonuclease/exonuclease/phosphatase (EEP) superfamily protein YafD
LNSAAPYLFLPLLPLLIMAARVPRRKVVGALVALPLLAFMWLYGGRFLPRLEAAPTGPALRVMTFNVLNETRDYAALAEVVRAAAPDIVGLQEVTPAHAAAFGALLADYPYQYFPHGTDIYDVGLLSKYPLEAAEDFALPPLDLALRAVVNVNGRRVRVYVIHLSSDNYPLLQAPAWAAERLARRAAEIAQLRAELATQRGQPVLLLCDCNLTDNSAGYRSLEAALGDSYREAGWGFGFTLQPLYAPLPIQRIDYIWHSADFYTTDAQVAGRGGSDHHALWAELILKPASP